MGRSEPPTQGVPITQITRKGYFFQLHASQIITSMATTSKAAKTE
jgi:hypothetical protein